MPGVAEIVVAVVTSLLGGAFAWRYFKSDCRVKFGGGSSDFDQSDAKTKSRKESTYEDDEREGEKTRTRGNKRERKGTQQTREQAREGRRNDGRRQNLDDLNRPAHSPERDKFQETEPNAHEDRSNRTATPKVSEQEFLDEFEEDDVNTTPLSIHEVTKSPPMYRRRAMNQDPNKTQGSKMPESNYLPIRRRTVHNARNHDQTPYNPSHADNFRRYQTPRQMGQVTPRSGESSNHFEDDRVQRPVLSHDARRDVEEDLNGTRSFEGSVQSIENAPDDATGYTNSNVDDEKVL